MHNIVGDPVVAVDVPLHAVVVVHEHLRRGQVLVRQERLVIDRAVVGQSPLAEPRVRDVAGRVVHGAGHVQELSTGYSEVGDLR